MKRLNLLPRLAISHALILVPLFLFLLWQTPAVLAANWTVNTTSDSSDGSCNDGTCSLRDAILLAAPNDVIELPAGSYTLSPALGALNVAKSLEIVGLGGTAVATLIDGNHSTRLFNISGGTTTLRNLTLQNGQPASGSGGGINATGVGSVVLDNAVVRSSVSPGHGGGIMLAGGSLTIQNGSEISGNSASQNGGGIYSNNGAINLTDSIVAQNSASGGGGIALNQPSATLVMTNSQVLNNSGTAPGPTSFPGGGILIINGSATINSGLISGNTAFRGAGILVSNGTATINGGTLTDNESNYGGAVYVRQSAALLTINGGSLTANRSVATIFGGGALYIFQGSVVQNGGAITNNTAVNYGGAMEVRFGSFTMNGGTLSGNSAGNWGGAIYNDGGTVTINSGTLAGNSSSSFGGAIATGSSSVNTLTNATLSGNSAVAGGGLYNTGSTTLNNVTLFGNSGGLSQQSGTMSLGNSIVAGNGGDCSGTINSLGYNLIQNSAGCTLGGTTTGNIGGDPQLGPLASNGGSSQTHAIAFGSPALDAANNATCAATDQRGIVRPQDGNGDSSTVCDMGAFELETFTGPTPTPTNTATATNTVAPTATATATSTIAPTNTATVGSSPTATSTAVPTQTATATSTIAPTNTPEPSTSYTFTAAADTTLLSNRPTTNFGLSTQLSLDASPDIWSLLRFNVAGLPGSVTGATLRVFTTTDSTVGLTAAAVADNSWVETAVTYNTAPTPGSTLNSSGSIAAGSWIELDVTSHVTGDGQFSLALTSSDANRLILNSRETGNPPELVVHVALGPTPTPTNTVPPTATATATNTPLPTNTPTVGPSPTATNTAVPTHTATATSTIAPTNTPEPSTSYTFTAAADTTLLSNRPTTNFGLSTQLSLDASPDIWSLLRFNVTGLPGSVTSATLRVFTANESSAGLTASAVTDNSWGETAVTYNTAPTPGSTLNSSGSIMAGSWVEIDVTGYISGDGQFSLALTSTDTNRISLSSRETGNPPELVVNVALGPTPPNSVPPTNTPTAGASGSASDIFACTPLSLRETTICTYSLFWNGGKFGLSGLA